LKSIYPRLNAVEKQKNFGGKRKRGGGEKGLSPVLKPEHKDPKGGRKKGTIKYVVLPGGGDQGSTRRKKRPKGRSFFFFEEKRKKGRGQEGPNRKKKKRGEEKGGERGTTPYYIVSQLMLVAPAFSKKKKKKKREKVTRKRGAGGEIGSSKGLFLAHFPCSVGVWEGEKGGGVCWRRPLGSFGKGGRGKKKGRTR